MVLGFRVQGFRVLGFTGYGLQCLGLIRFACEVYLVCASIPRFGGLGCAV